MVFLDGAAVKRNVSKGLRKPEQNGYTGTLLLVTERDYGKRNESGTLSKV